MRNTANTLAAVSALCFFAYTQIDTAQEENSKSEVSISAEAQGQIQKQPPDVRKRMEAAIKVGNQYAPHHFDGTAYARNDPEQEQLWQKNIQPLVTLQADLGNGGWYYPGGVFADSAPKLEINGVQVLHDVVCPSPELVSANLSKDHLGLIYRTKIIGMWRSRLKKVPTLNDFVQDEFIPDKKEEYDEVLLVVDNGNRVSRVDAKHLVYSSIPKQRIEMYESFIKWPPARLYQGSDHAEQETEEQARARIPQYKKYIEMIKSEEAAACNGATGSANQHQGKE